MKIAVFGLTVSSSWGNGHATLWRGLIGGLARRGVQVTFFERDVPYYAAHRDLWALDGGRLVLYADWAQVRQAAREAVRTTDAVIVTSYCPDAIDAAVLIAEEATGTSVFYDMDTGVTLARLEAGEAVPYLPPEGLGGFDLVLSYTGGSALTALRERLGARRTAALYGHVDPRVHRPAPPNEAFRCDLSWIGTYADDRQAALAALFLDPARRGPARRFVLAGSGYPQAFPWSDNIWFVRHLPPADHAGFFAASRLTLNITRREMAAMGWAPSGRLFEATACGTAVLSDGFEGLDDFFEPGREIIVAATTEQALEAMSLTDAELARIAKAGRERTLAEHTADRRAGELLRLLDDRAPAEARPAMAAEA